MASTSRFIPHLSCSKLQPLVQADVVGFTLLCKNALRIGDHAVGKGAHLQVLAHAFLDRQSWQPFAGFFPFSLVDCPVAG